jgi:hypothetical protein
MHDDIARIHQHPVALALAADRTGAVADSFSRRARCSAMAPT